MRELNTKLFLIAACLVISSQAIAADTFVEYCLGKTKILTATLDCRLTLDDRVSTLEFVLKKGEKMKVTSSGQFGKLSKSLSVKKINHLPPSITDMGVIAESVEFQAPFGSSLATMTIPCQQSDLALVGVAQVSGNEEPKQAYIGCQVK